MTALLAMGVRERFRDRIAVRLGLSFDDNRLDFLGEVLRRRADARGLTAESYVAQIGVDESEIGPLAEELTVGETYFFRDGNQFRALTEIVLPDLMRRQTGVPINLLSAACSSGEEAYTIAMLISSLAETAPRQSVIRAVDINPAALQKARDGRYSSWAMRETPAEMQQRWFAPQGREMVLSSALKSNVRFDQRNLVDRGGDVWVPDTYDVVFCRNAIMYFTTAVQRDVVTQIAASLKPGGYLFLGHAETLRGLSDAFRLVQANGTFFYQRKPTTLAVKGWRDVPAPAELRFPVIPPAPEERDPDWYNSILGAGKRIEALVQDAEPDVVVSGLKWRSDIAFELVRHERFAEALELVEQLPPKLRAEPDVLLLEALLLVQAGRPAAAGEVCATLLRQNAGNAGANYVLALCYEGLGDTVAAARHYEMAGNFDEGFAMPRLRAGMLSRRSGEISRARDQLRLAISLFDGEDDSRLLLFGGGFTRAALMRLSEAELLACGVET